MHDDAQVPAVRRLYFTATPRIADDRRAKDGLADLTDTDSEVTEKLPALCSMDDESIYGPTVFTWTLGQGIEHGYLDDYRVLVPVVTDEDLRDLLNLPAVADLRSQRTNEELLRLAVLRAVADLELRRVITFHSRVSGTREFADGLPAAAAMLKDADRPERLTALAVAGTDRLKDRRAAFATFKASTGEDGEQCCIICNSRLLTEGIDVAAVGAVCFAGPKSSVIDIVQAVGWALRLAASPGRLTGHPQLLPGTGASSSGRSAKRFPAGPADRSQATPPCSPTTASTPGPSSTNCPHRSKPLARRSTSARTGSRSSPPAWKVATPHGRRKSMPPGQEVRKGRGCQVQNLRTR
ncbi:helicase-related protein [Kitasatospora sp. NPDC096204]|uniref:helicase-related protein n=1 Tax=Kitasatospora sp. NPDC096204 TaxID=3364094 RepID=UPI00380ECCAD